MPSDVLVSAAFRSVTSDATTLALRLQGCKNGRHRAADCSCQGLPERSGSSELSQSSRHPVSPRPWDATVKVLATSHFLHPKITAAPPVPWNRPSCRIQEASGILLIVSESEGRVLEAFVKADFLSQRPCSLEGLTWAKMSEPLESVSLAERPTKRHRTVSRGSLWDHTEQLVRLQSMLLSAVIRQNTQLK